MKQLTNEEKGEIIGLVCKRRGIDILNQENLSKAETQEIGLIDLILDVVSAYNEVLLRHEQ